MRRSAGTPPAPRLRRMLRESAPRDAEDAWLYRLDVSHTHALLEHPHFRVQDTQLASDAICTSYALCAVSLLLTGWQTVLIETASPPQTRSNALCVFILPPAGCHNYQRPPALGMHARSQSPSRTYTTFSGSKGRLLGMPPVLVGRHAGSVCPQTLKYTLHIILIPLVHAGCKRHWRRQLHCRDRMLRKSPPRGVASRACLSVLPGRPIYIHSAHIPLPRAASKYYWRRKVHWNIRMQRKCVCSSCRGSVCLSVLFEGLRRTRTHSPFTYIFPFYAAKVGGDAICLDWNGCLVRLLLATWNACARRSLLLGHRHTSNFPQIATVCTVIDIIFLYRAQQLLVMPFALLGSHAKLCSILRFGTLYTHTCSWLHTCKCACQH
jgi:hypothetical protein